MPDLPTNPSGRSKSANLKTRDFKYEFWKAMKEVEGEKRKTLMKHTVEMAFQNPEVLKSVINKMLPDLSESDAGQNLINIIRHLSDEQLKK